MSFHCRATDKTILLESLRTAFEHGLLFQHGVDRLDRPVIWVFGRYFHRKLSPVAIMAGLYCLEQAMSKLQSDEHKFVIVVDLCDFTMNNMDAKWVIAIVKAVKSFYFEQLGTLMVINSSSAAFNLMWNTVKRLARCPKPKDFRLVGRDFKSPLLALISEDQIPQDLGGTASTSPKVWFAQALGPVPAGSA